MSCNCCCTKTLNFCSQDICGGEIDFDVLAQKNGVHKLSLDYLNGGLTISKTFEIDDKLIFPIDLLNEAYEYTSQLTDPDGVTIVIRKDDIDYDCFRFRTRLTVALVSVEVEESA